MSLLYDFIFKFKYNMLNCFKIIFRQIKNVNITQKLLKSIKNNILRECVLFCLCCVWKKERKKTNSALKSS